MKDWLSVLLLGAICGAAAGVWPAAPDPFPIHFSASGVADRFAPKAVGLLLVPGLAVVSVAGLWALGRAAGMAQVARELATVRVVLAAFYLALFGAVLASAMGGVNPALIVNVALGVLLIVLGAVSRTVEPNGLFGIRTPWTLRSDRVWRETHAHAAPLLAVLGALVLAVVAARPSMPVFLPVSLLIAGAAWLTVYSWLSWRREPHTG